jgi:hypothetical protein
MKDKDIPESEVKVKISTCSKCNGGVRFAIEHSMDKQSKKDFMKEVSEYNLNIKTITLAEYRASKVAWCDC